MSDHTRMSQLYAEKDTPWDDVLPPPEVITAVSAIPAGRALDLGCGYGRAAIYLAAHGWQVDGIDFVAAAIAEAKRRAAAADVTATFHHHPVTDLSFLHPPYDLAVDVGCAHALDVNELRAYQAELKRLLRPGARYLVFGRIAPENPTEDGPPGFDETLFHETFQDGFDLESADYGSTQVRDDPAWRSAWFTFTRRPNAAEPE